MNKTVVVFGGSGFLGKYIVCKLAKEGYIIKVACRNPMECQSLKVLGYVGQVTPIRLNILNADSVNQIVKESDMVVNCVGILYPAGKGQKFDAVHHQGAENIAKAVKKYKNEKFIHISAIGADKNSPADYARTKGLGEEAVKKLVPSAIILRPSVVFGPEDQFFNFFAAMARLTCTLPLIGGGETKFQPVYVNDIAETVKLLLETDKFDGGIFELGGPAQYSFKELLELMLKVIERKAFFIPIPVWAAKIEAFFLEKLPNPILTRDQIKLLEKDNVVSGQHHGFEDIGMTPQSVELILPSYMFRFRKAGKKSVE